MCGAPEHYRSTDEAPFQHTNVKKCLAGQVGKFESLHQLTSQTWWMPIHMWPSYYETSIDINHSKWWMDALGGVHRAFSPTQAHFVDPFKDNTQQGAKLSKFLFKIIHLTLLFSIAHGRCGAWANVWVSAVSKLKVTESDEKACRHILMRQLILNEWLLYETQCNAFVYKNPMISFKIFGLLLMELHLHQRGTFDSWNRCCVIVHI